MHPRHVVIEFKDYATALACYESEEYRRAIDLAGRGERLRSSWSSRAMTVRSRADRRRIERTFSCEGRRRIGDNGRHAARCDGRRRAHGPNADQDDPRDAGRRSVRRIGARRLDRARRRCGAARRLRQGRRRDLGRSARRHSQRRRHPGFFVAGRDASNSPRWPRRRASSISSARRASPADDLNADRARRRATRRSCDRAI